ncbi:MAG TPA: hypothetical protein VK324_06800, partial [Tepidisphaeraceae bacterium]|nr:hypothetical protein [Tepidisphaeraceae bacterium]
MSSAAPSTRWYHGFIPRRPAVPAATLFIAGIALHAVAPRVPWAWLGVTALAITAAAVRLNRPVWSTASL